MLASMAAVNRASCGRICTLGLDVLIVLEHAGQQQQQEEWKRELQHCSSRRGSDRDNCSTAAQWQG
jgi:hypothetical protein